MQPASAAFAAAVTSPRRHPITRVLLDFDGDGYGPAGSLDDLGPMVTDWSIDRDLTTELPSEIRRFSGHLTATATVTLAGSADGDPRHTAAWWASPTNTESPIYGKQWTGRPIRILAGFVTTSGPEYVTVMEGLCRTLTASRGDGTATLEVVDLMDTFNARADLPIVLADDLTPDGGRKPGLNASWVVDWILRNRGWHLSPPARPNSKVVATFHGSAQPERGQLLVCHSSDYDPPNFGTGRWLQAIQFGGHAVTRCAIRPTDLDGDNYSFRSSPTRTISCEGWMKTSAAGRQGLAMVSGGANGGVGLFVNASGNIAVIQRNDNGTWITNTAANVSDGGWHYVGLTIQYGGNTCQITVRKDNQSAVFGTPSGFNNTAGDNEPQLELVHFGRSYVDSAGTIEAFAGQLEDWQWTPDNLAALGWNDDWAPSRPVQVSPSQNRLLATPPTAEQTDREILANIAAAEGAVVGFTETGKFQYLTRATLTAAPYTNPVRVLTTARVIKDLATSQSIDAVRNRVIVNATVPSVGNSDTGAITADVWNANSIITLAGGQTKVFAITFGEQIANLDTTVVYAGTSIGLAESRYRASRARSGGTVVSNLDISIRQHGDYAFVTIVNPNSFQVYINNPSGLSGVTKGLPALTFRGTQIRFEQASGQAVKAEAQNSTSVDLYGEQVLELDDQSGWRQNLDDIQPFAAELLGRLATPRSVMQDVPIVGDPRLQPADRVNLEDPKMLKLDMDYRIERAHLEFGADGLSGSLGLREL